jgi:hypothetical protein
MQHALAQEELSESTVLHEKGTPILKSGTCGQ